MRNTTKRLLALILAAGMMLPLAACAKGDGNTETTAGDSQAETEAGTGYKPDIKKTDYKAEFTFLNCSSILDDELFAFEERGLLPMLVKTDFAYGGLTEELAQKAIELLNGSETI